MDSNPSPSSGVLFAATASLSFPRMLASYAVSAGVQARRSSARPARRLGGSLEHLLVDLFQLKLQADQGSRSLWR
jgi:hypothetical protein